MQPIDLPANTPRDRFYAGGQRIADFRGLPEAHPNTPEDWIASVTPVAGASPAGLTVLADGRTLAEAIVADPEAWLGAAHVAAFGSDPRLLTKLLDPGQRLPVHAHPDDGFAARHLGAAHGKAEAWYILEPGVVHLGLTDDLPRDHLLRLIAHQSTAELLGRLHAFEVAAGDSVYVPPGMLHAIGEGTFLLEVQQPEDLSILVEWRGFDLDGPRDGHLGLGFETATRAITLDATTEAELSALVRRRPGAGNVLAAASAEYFRLTLAHGPGPDAGQPAGFAVATAHAGPAVLQAPVGGEYRLAAGSTTLIPFAFGEFVVAAGSVVLARPPEPR